jgi:hypothetical protein
LETNGKLIYSNNKEVGGERASLANSPLRIEGSGGLTIDKYREGGAGDACMNEINESGREAHPVKCSSDEIPVDAVKSLGEIKLEEKSLVLPTSETEGVDDFLCDDNIRGNMSVLNKSRLRKVNKPREMGLQSVSQRFSNDFINNIT